MLMLREKTVGKVIDLDRCYEASDRQIAVSRRSQALLAAAGQDRPSRRWFVITVYSGDRAVTDRLVDAGIECWMPHVMVKPPRRGGMTGNRPLVARPAFPGYVFVRIAATGEAWSGLSGVDRRIGHMLGSSNGRPIAINDSVVNVLKAYMQGDPAAVDIVTNAIKPGDNVMVKDGPFLSFPGVVARVDPAHFRAYVDVMIFGRITPVELELAQLAKL